MSHATAQPPTDQDYAQFVRRVQALTGIDLTAYKPDQMRRRLGSLMYQRGIKTFTDYAAVLAREPDRLKEFTDFFTINVSEFFRDPPKWEQLRSLLPALLRSRPRLSIWSAGCSIGAEPYTLAMLLSELTPTTQHKILATDIDRTILNRAQRGEDYREAELRHLPATHRQRFFSRSGPDSYAITDELRRRVTYQRHNLLADRYPSDCDLILCRNVVIYFTDEAKAGIYRRFQAALQPQGLLFVGATEIIMQAQVLGLRTVINSFYTPSGHSAS
jgi:chemotaxis protein methyltransferase CheR